MMKDENVSLDFTIQSTRTLSDEEQAAEKTSAQQTQKETSQKTASSKGTAETPSPTASKDGNGKTSKGKNKRTPTVSLKNSIFPKRTQTPDKPAPQPGPKREYGNDYGRMLLLDREMVFEKIHKEEDIDAQIKYFALYALMFSAIYGLFLGTFFGGFQLIAGAIKIPVLLFGTLSLCLPALYMFNVLLGSRLSFRQTLLMLLVTTYLMSALMASLAPILFFFIMTTTSNHFITLLAVISCTISGVFAVELLLQGMRYLTVKNGYSPNIRVVKVWALLYAIVGSQLSWGLRPFIGTPGTDFVFFRPTEGNFYISVFKTIMTLLSEFLAI